MKLCRTPRADEVGGLFRRARAVLDTTRIVIDLLFFPVLGTGIWRELSVNFMALSQSSDMQVDLNTLINSCHNCVLTVLPPAKSASAAWRYYSRLV